MLYPWLNKNPFMSMWLSAANRMAGTMRGQATAEATRQARTAVTKATNANFKAVFDVPTPASPEAQAKRKTKPKPEPKAKAKAKRQR
jgi:hypothetical protein